MATDDKRASSRAIAFGLARVSFARVLRQVNQPPTSRVLRREGDRRRAARRSSASATLRSCRVCASARSDCRAYDRPRNNSCFGAGARLPDYWSIALLGAGSGSRGHTAAPRLLSPRRSEAHRCRSLAHTREQQPRRAAPRVLRRGVPRAGPRLPIYRTYWIDLPLDRVTRHLLRVKSLLLRDKCRADCR